MHGLDGAWTSLINRSSCDLIAGFNQKKELDSAVEPQNGFSVELRVPLKIGFSDKSPIVTY
jgi:hypothetical protein